MNMRPFWRYYGGKWRAAPRYPKPRHATIVEPFAGAAGYSMRYPRLDVILVERYAVIAEMWRYLIAVSPAELRAIPEVDHVDALPSWVPAGARSLIGFCMNSAVTSPCKTLSSGCKKQRENGITRVEGWSKTKREIVASQVGEIRHWRVIEGDYTLAPDIEATWFVDPPYDNTAGKSYVHCDLDHAGLGVWCRARKGQVIACENVGATWLPFRPFASTTSPMTGRVSQEAIWTNTGEPWHYDAGLPQGDLFDGAA